MQIDKWLHLISGVSIAIIAGLLFNKLTGFILALTVGAGKELHDYIRPETNTPDVWDFVATAAGAAFGMLPFLIFT